MKATNIIWDIDEDENINLPTEVEIPSGLTDVEEISDWLSEEFEYCHKGFALYEDEDDKTLSFNGTEYTVKVGNYPSHPLAMWVSIQNVKATSCENEIITVNLGNFYRDSTFVQPGSSFINTGSGFEEHYIKLLEETNLAKPYVCFGKPFYKGSGFNDYPLYEFDKKMLQELDPKGWASYMEKWFDEAEKIQKMM